MGWRLFYTVEMNCERLDVPSPPCGMATIVVKLSDGFLTGSSEPTVWDGDHPLEHLPEDEEKGSEPTVWDGDLTKF